MATSLKEIYDTFFSKVEDYSFIKLNKDGHLEDLLIKYLTGAIVKFSNCTKELSVDRTLHVVRAIENREEKDLNVSEIEILTSFMLLQYSTGKILSIKNMDMVLTKAEYYTYSQANHILSLIEIKKEVQKDVSHLMNLYSLKYGSGDIFK